MKQCVGIKEMDIKNDVQEWRFLDREDPDQEVKYTNVQNPSEVGEAQRKMKKRNVYSLWKIVYRRKLK